MPKGIPKNGINKGWFKGENAGYWLGKKRSKETIAKMSKSLMGRAVWNKGKSFPQMIGNQHCIGRIPWNKGKKHLQDEKHPLWKGDKVGYYALHAWIQRKLGKPQRCENCKTEKQRKYHWANKSHEYKRDITDWIRLCVQCHSQFDRGLLSICP